MTEFKPPPGKRKVAKAMKLAEAATVVMDAAHERIGALQSEIVKQEHVVAALIVAARRGLPVDVQELLLYGEASRGIPPNILRDMLAAAISQDVQ